MLKLNYQQGVATTILIVLAPAGFYLYLFLCHKKYVVSSACYINQEVNGNF